MDMKHNPNDKKVSKDTTPNKDLSKPKKQKKKRKHRFLFGLGIFFLIIFIITLVGGGIFIHKYLPNLPELTKESKEIINNISENDFKTHGTSHVYDKDGNEMFEIKSDKDIEYLPYDKIPKNIINAFVSIEDKRFWKHKGIDLIGLSRAGVSLFKNNGEITQGGSTITQQLVKLTYLTNEQTFPRKYKEMLIARALEKEFSKEEILEFYINNIYFNNNVYGINAASLKYFDKTVDKLSLSQTAFLAAIPNNPTIYDPYTKKDKTIERRDIILQVMLEQEYITQSEYDEAIKEDIQVLEPKKSNEYYDTRKDFVIKEFTELLMRDKGFEFKYSFNTYEEREKYLELYQQTFDDTQRLIYKKGYDIYTSFDNDLQKKSQEIIDDKFSYNTEVNEDNIYQLQGSSVTIENETGLILSMVGGRTSPSIDYLDRSYNTLRQNGSTMKPIGVYGPAFDLLDYLPSTKKSDENEKNGPRNSTGYYGTLSLRDAIKVSSNTIAWKVYREVTPEKGMKYLQEMEFSSIVPDDMRLPSGLGGLTLGTNPLEMAGAYATIANNGKFNRPQCIVEIKDITGKSIYKHKNLNKQIYKESTAAMLEDCLKGVFDFGSTKGNRIDNGIDSAGKTGTTNDDKDGWFAGYSPKYTTVFWAGYDIPRKVPNLYGRIKPVGIWKEIMNYAHRNDKDLSFDKSDSVVEVWVNSNGERVPDGTGTREIFPISKIPSENEYAFESQKKNNYYSKINECFSMVVSNKNDFEILKANAETLKSEISNSDLSSDSKNSLINQINSKLEDIKKKIEEKDKPIEKPEDKPIEKPIEKPEEKPEDKPIDKPIEKPEDKPIDKPIES